ncbi:MAG: hypothetical protein ACYCQJ_06585 [Nitrososphaerales archaeon]
MAEEKKDYKLKTSDKVWIILAVAILVVFLIFVVVYGLDFVGI